MRETRKKELCARIRAIREEACGRRGKSAFAKMLGLSASTYDYYESSRVPPADVLVAIADAGGVDLRWLITGHSGGATVPAGLHPVVRRAARLLGDQPEAADALGAFLDILAESAKFSRPNPLEAATDAGGAAQDAGEMRAPDAQKPAASRPQIAPKTDDEHRATWIPVLGRSAAGVPHFWPQAQDAEGVVSLIDVVNRYAGRTDLRSRTAHAETTGAADETVQVVTLGEGNEETAEFVAAAGVRRRWGDAFAVRIDGDSMAPDIRHGDLVLLSPSEPAADGRPAVVQLAGQIGVTCKLYRCEGDRVHLVPINDQFPPQDFPASNVEWAFRVLGTVRPQ